MLLLLWLWRLYKNNRVYWCLGLRMEVYNCFKCSNSNSKSIPVNFTRFLNSDIFIFSFFFCKFLYTPVITEQWIRWQLPLSVTGQCYSLSLTLDSLVELWLGGLSAGRLLRLQPVAFESCSIGQLIIVTRQDRGKKSKLHLSFKMNYEILVTYGYLLDLSIRPHNLLHYLDSS